MKNRIVSERSSVLRKVAKPVPKNDIGSKKIAGIIRTMKAALRRENDGVALAAPQIGKSLRIFIVSGKTLAQLYNKEASEASEDLEDLVFINPELIKLSKKKKSMEEGCLSLRWLYGRVERSEKASIRALDEKGKPFAMGASGLLSQIFQHEMDHLNGILFIDKAREVENIPPKPKRKAKQNAGQK